MFSFFSMVKSITIRELATKLNDNILLLDVRTPAEYRQGHIIKAKNVPLNKIAAYKEKGDKAIYVICQSGMRSKQAAQQLKRKGYNVINVKGGMNQWSGKVKGGKS
ncbi:sulfurtransferase [Enterococcus saigonensis]|uniref:Sulfurtransferase n=1 Tax=Enterococcus saigonensis TaxID=1805431 RepID=A0A679IL51_9ENTE|nr:rhodanese-like domain-containing protein [Enterococcus saigonensis]BCA86882.1 sulfurtransferase [Enterococcus saigonensis]